jgi:hypothetical protein
VSENEIVGVEKHAIWEGAEVVRRLKSFLRGKPWRRLEVATLD